MKNVLIVILFLTLGLMACGTDHSKHDHSDEAKTTAPTTEAKAEVKTDTTKHVHAYVCPMHPEVTSEKEGEKCPKCGMALEHKD